MCISDQGAEESEGPSEAGWCWNAEGEKDSSEPLEAGGWSRESLAHLYAHCKKFITPNPCELLEGSTQHPPGSQEECHGMGKVGWGSGCLEGWGPGSRKRLRGPGS